MDGERGGGEGLPDFQHQDKMCISHLKPLRNNSEVNRNNEET